MDSNSVNIADNFFGMIKNLSPEVRLDLISRISESLKSKESNKTTTKSWDDLFGAYTSTESADEIIDDLRAQRTINRDIEGL